MKKIHIDENKAIELHSLGKSTYEVAKAFNISQTQVRRILLKNNIQPHSIKTDDVTEDNILMYYNNGLSSEQIAKDMNISPTTVCRVIKRKGFELKKAGYFNRKYSLNETFLDDIDTQEKAYFLGFMYADGCVHKRKNNFNITLHAKDVELLEKFSHIFYGFDKIVTTDGGYKALTIYSSKLCLKLIENGCMPAKTFKIKFPHHLPKELISHFLRGLYDGDGCIYIAESGRVRVSLTGYSEFLTEVKQYLHALNIYSILRIVKGDKVADLSVSKNYDSREFLRYLYKDANIYLDRKFKKYLEAMEILEKKNAPSKFYGSTNIVSYNGNKLTKQYIEGLSDDEKTEVAEFLFNYFRRNGFPYDRFDDDELVSDFKSLCNSNIKLINNNELSNIGNAGLKIFKGFCHHYYKVSDGRMPCFEDAFNDDKLLMKAIKNRLGFFFDTKEAFNITGNMIRQGLRNGRIAFAASIFKPSVAKFFYDKFQAKNVLDISAGFGQRMVGACATKSIESYTGLDPWNETISALTDIKDFLSFSNKEISLHQIGSENFLSEKRFDFCFSSPPFFNKEIYCADGSQAYSNGLEGFMNWWRKTAQNVHQMLSGRYFVINMDQKIIIDMLAKSSDLFALDGVYKINFKRAHLTHDSSDVYYVLRKV